VPGVAVDEVGQGGQMNDGMAGAGAPERTLAGFLDALASEAPAPGGGAAAALQAALGAALVSMVCNLTIGKPRYAEHEATMLAARAEAEKARVTALALADEDAVAFGAVSAAYKLPKDTDEAKAARSAAIQAALRGAADVPLRTAAVAAEVVSLCARILDGANVNVLSDVAVAAASARAALASADINVWVNAQSMTDEPTRAATLTELAGHLAVSEAAEEIVRTVRDRIGA
jgi:formiminotetrahydrofolate cyclodeaminase